jgi:hypothetical protein
MARLPMVGGLQRETLSIFTVVTLRNLSFYNSNFNLTLA